MHHPNEVFDMDTHIDETDVNQRDRNVDEEDDGDSNTQTTSPQTAHHSFADDDTSTRERNGEDTNMTSLSANVDSDHEESFVDSTFIDSDTVDTTAEHRRNHHLNSLRAARIRIKNRRRAYLERNPQYFEAPDLELADPLQYDRCIRRFQSAAEREADGRAKGWSGVLEADLYRSEAKIAAVQSAKSAAADNGSEELLANTEDGDGEDAPNNREEGLERWRYEMTMRFLHGLDSDFEYKAVDENEELDEIEVREEQERWFEEEEPEWFDESGEAEGVIAGETGIQDF